MNLTARDCNLLVYFYSGNISLSYLSIFSFFKYFLILQGGCNSILKILLLII